MIESMIRTIQSWMMAKYASAWLLLSLQIGLGLVPPPTWGQEPFAPVCLPSTEERIIESWEVGVTYKLYVALPREHGKAGAAYPVVYLLDADYSFAIARNLVEHLSDRGDLQEAILVGVAYDGAEAYRRNRTRDYTPTHVPTGGYGPEIQAVSGGAPAFLRFLANELVPFIEREYPASPRRFLVGHSYGGLFAAWVLLTLPELFQGYVIVSPSLWYDDGMIFELERKTAESRSDMKARVYMNVGSLEGNREHHMVEDLQRFAARLEERNHSGLRLQWKVSADESHNSIFPGALSSGLRFVLDARR